MSLDVNCTIDQGFKRILGAKILQLSNKLLGRAGIRARASLTYSQELQYPCTDCNGTCRSVDSFTHFGGRLFQPRGAFAKYNMNEEDVV